MCAAQVLGETLSGRSLSLAFEIAFRKRSGLSPSDQSAVRDICYQSLRSLGLLDAQLAALLVTPIRHPALRHLLLVGLAQLQFTRAKPYAVVDHAVQAAERIGQPAARGLVNAVLRNYLRRRKELGPERWNEPEVRYGFPSWWIEKLRGQHPAQWEEVVRSAALHPPLTLRVNSRRSTVPEYLSLLEGGGIAGRALSGQAVRIEPMPVQAIPGFKEGLVSVQDLGAQLAVRCLVPLDGERVLDACAAPGGKTGHLLEAANVELTAVDQDATRLERVRENLARLGLQAKLICADAARPQDWWDGVPYGKILLDAPCSASGVCRRHPDIRWTRRPSDLARFAAQQASLLDAMWQVLENSGKLLYATCSVFKEENDEVVASFLARQPDARCVAVDPALPPGGWVLPNEERDGFFYALLEKR
jgi:16S rRNA (cytosine967-C5)-methyltransferase